MILIVVGVFAGFIVVLGILLTNFLLNKTLQQPVKAVKKIGAPLLGIFPVVDGNEAFIKKANMRLMQQLLAKVSFDKKPVVICVFSNQKAEGKTSLVKSWQNELERLNYKVQNPVWDPKVERSINNTVDLVLLEIPPLENIIITKTNLPKIDMAILVCRANRIWNRIDDELLDIFTKTSGVKPMLVLNGVEIDHAEEYLGEVPKKRSFIRAFVKRIAKMEFGNKKVILIK